MKIAVGMTVVMNERVEQRRASFLSAISAGFGRVDWAYDYIQSSSRENLGPYGNFRKCLRILLNNHRDADSLLVLQDDIDISVNLKPWLLANLTSDVWNERTGAVSLYCAGPHTRETTGWFKLDPCEGKNSYGALAIMMPRERAKQFVADAPYSDTKTRTCFWLAEWCRTNNYDYWLHSPSFVKHTGKKSLVDPRFDDAPAVQRFRQAGLFLPDASNFSVVEDLRA
jgi:hypothetical protein